MLSLWNVKGMYEPGDRVGRLWDNICGTIREIDYLSWGQLYHVYWDDGTDTWAGAGVLRREKRREQWKIVR